MWHADGKEGSGGHFAGPAGQRTIGAKLFIDFFLTFWFYWSSSEVSVRE